MKYETAGEPIGGLKWTRKTTKKIAEALGKLGIEVSRNTVGRLLKQLDFRLRVNHKKRSTVSPRDRDRQLRLIRGRRNEFIRQGDPIVSVDTKKKELVGNFRNAGMAWKQEAMHTLANDFRSDAKGIAIPYGLYDLLQTVALLSSERRERPPRLPSMVSSRGGNTKAKNATSRANAF